MVERADRQAFIKSLLHYYQASDSELTSVAVAYYWLISIFPPAFGGGQYPPLFSDSSFQFFKGCQ